MRNLQTSHSTSADRVPAIELRDVCKQYANGTVANQGVSFDVAEGEIHAIVGENGAGKSTVMKMLYGLEQPSAGSILVDGHSIVFAHPREAIAAGIGLVPQHLKLVPSFTVSENIVLGREPKIGPFIDRKKVLADVEKLSSHFGLQVDPNAIMSSLSVGVQQRIEILKALYRGARILLFDEPTALLTPQETDGLFKAVQALVASGITVVVITHKLSEVRAISDRFTVLRGGKVTGRGRTADVSEAEIAEMIVGRSLASTSVKRVAAKAGTAVVQARGVTVMSPLGRPRLLNLSFDVAAGEILGIAGVEGNGQDALSQVLSGAAAPTLGAATINGERFTGRGVRAARRLRVAAIPEDRLYNGVAPNLSVEENIAAASYYAAPFSRFGVLNFNAIRDYAKKLIEKFGVRTASSETPIKALSGGNMQKVVLAREFSTEPVFLIASQPTRGVDIGAAGALRDQLIALRDSGTAVLLISADLDEIVALSDRIAVLYQGEIVAHFQADEVDQREIGLFMTDLKRQEGATATLAATAPETGEFV